MRFEKKWTEKEIFDYLNEHHNQDELPISQKKFVRRETSPRHSDIMRRRVTDMWFGVPTFRNMLNNIQQKAQVTAENTMQWGTVVDVIHDRYGVPACIKVIYQTDTEWGYDYIAPNDVTMYEPFDTYIPNDEYYDHYVESCVVEGSDDEDECDEGEQSAEE